MFKDFLRAKPTEKIVDHDPLTPLHEFNSLPLPPYSELFVSVGCEAHTATFRDVNGRYWVGDLARQEPDPDGRRIHFELDNVRPLKIDSGG